MIVFPIVPKKQMKVKNIVFTHVPKKYQTLEFEFVLQHFFKYIFLSLGFWYEIGSILSLNPRKTMLNVIFK